MEGDIHTCVDRNYVQEKVASYQRKAKKVKDTKQIKRRK